MSAEQTRTIKPNTKTTPTFEFFFKRLDYYLDKGKGFSVFLANEAVIQQFLSRCQEEKIAVQFVRISALPEGINELPSNGLLTVVIQDLPFDQFFNKIQTIVDQLIFPLWFQKRSICFFSMLDQSSYRLNNFSTGLIHKNLDLVNRFLLLEQMFSLLGRVNVPFSSPETLLLSADKTIFTPIEEKMRDGLEAARLSYEPQVKMGRYTVDFLVQTGSGSMIVECDGAAYHSPEKDAERDQVLSLQDYPIIHFSGSQINANVEKCIEAVVQHASNQQPQYPIDENLDEDQKAAVETIAGPVRVLAPAGSGKTKTLTNRIAYLLNQGIEANKILTLAFNKKASAEMQQRLEEKMIRDVDVRTFHSLGYEIIRKAWKWTFDDKNRRHVIRDMMWEAVAKHHTLPPRRGKDPLDGFLDALRRAKMELIPTEEITVEYDDKEYPFEPVFHDYMEGQIKKHFMDFDDMIYLAVRILLDNPSCRADYQNRFEYVLVDEFQDLNRAQLLLLQILALPENNLFIVGDDDQMIYGWRGAEVRHILDFTKRFPIAKDHVLSTNYRSSKKIVRHSRWLIDQNKQRVPKDIRSAKTAHKGYFQIETAENLWEQSQKAAAWIQEIKTTKKLRWKDFAVLFRTNAFQISVALALDILKIPHTPVSGKHLFTTPVGRHVYSYLTVFLHPKDAKAEDIEVILKNPNKYFRNDLIEKATNWGKFRTLYQDPGLENWLSEKLLDFINRILYLQSRAADSETTSSALLSAMDTELGLKKAYQDNQKLVRELDEASDEVVFDVIKAIADHYPNLEAFYSYVHKAIHDEGEKTDDERSSHDEVVLSTIHKSKGKEYPNVVYFNLSEPDRSSDEQEEERRVSYVGATRARDMLFITCSKSKQSPFLRELAFANHLAGMTTEKIHAEIELKKQQLARRQGEAQKVKKQIQEWIDKFPELKDTTGEAWMSQNSVKRWVRNLLVKHAQNKVRALSEKFDLLNLEYVHPLSDDIELMEGEISFREKLLTPSNGKVS